MPAHAASNYTPCEGDASFLKDATDRRHGMWKTLQPLLAQEPEKAGDHSVRRLARGGEQPETYGYKPDPLLGEIFSKYRKMHNDGVFDATKARASHASLSLAVPASSCWIDEERCLARPTKLPFCSA